MGTLEPVPDCVVVVGGELEQSLEEEGRTDAASDIVKVKDWVQPFCSAGIIKQSHTSTIKFPFQRNRALVRCCYPVHRKGRSQGGGPVFSGF